MHKAVLGGADWYIRIDKHNQKKGQLKVGLCKRTRAESGGEKPRATKVMKMSLQEVKDAVALAQSWLWISIVRFACYVYQPQFPMFVVICIWV